jgi:hypothetical protein
MPSSPTRDQDQGTLLDMESMRRFWLPSGWLSRKQTDEAIKFIHTGILIAWDKSLPLLRVS